MPNAQSQLEGLKTRYDLMKTIAGLSPVILGAYFAFLGTLLKGEGVPWLYKAIAVGALLLAVLFCLITCWAITNVMIKDTSDSRWIGGCFIVTLGLFELGLVSIFLSLIFR